MMHLLSSLRGALATKQSRPRVGLDCFASLAMTGRRFARNQSGNVALMSAGGLLLALSCAALGVDVGAVFADKRKTQSVADIAAIVAAGDLSNAAKAAAAAVSKNSLPANALVSVEPGIYSTNAALAPSARFVASPAASANAVRVTLQTKTPLFFGKMLAGAEQLDVRASATASTTALATFAIGSRLASLNGGVVNALLGSMLGTSLSLSVLDYQALADAKIDTFDFLNALAAKAGVTAVSYDTLLSTNLKVTDVVSALLVAQKAANGVNAATAALTSVWLALAGVTTKVTPAALMSLGPYAGLTVGQKPKVSVTVSALDLLSATGSLSNGTNQISASVNAGLPGIASVSVKASIGERPVGTSWINVGAKGASVHTAQTRILLNVQLLGSGSVTSVNLPLYVEVASGSATLNALSCGYPNIANSSATLGVSPGIVDAWIGGVTAADLKNFSAKPNPPAAVLANVGLVSVSGRAHAAMANSAATPVNFSYADIQAQTKKTVNTTSFSSSLTASLLGDLSLNVQVGPLGLPIPGIGGVVSGIIGGATGPIDQIVASTLAALGVGLGQADVWVSGIRCDGAVLVN